MPTEFEFLETALPILVAQTGPHPARINEPLNLRVTEDFTLAEGVVTLGTLAVPDAFGTCTVPADAEIDDLVAFVLTDTLIPANTEVYGLHTTREGDGKAYAEGEIEVTP